MKYDRWDISGYDRDQTTALFRGGLNPLVAVVLSSRGIADPAEVRALTKCGPEVVGDPLSLRDMDRAARRVARALARREHIAVYGDYDVDGITGSCLLAKYFQSRGLTCEIYIPERLEEGYGVKKEGIDKLAAKNVTLIITVDCGITASAEVEYAASLGIDMIITDHHECGDVLPAAAEAVVDPKRTDCPYPYKMLAGVGVAFKLICAVEPPESFDSLLETYGDLVALGTIADVMPVTGENRFLIRRGLDVLRRGHCRGIKKLCAHAGGDIRQITAAGVGFTLSPRMNAAGRLGKTALAVRLLLTDDDGEADRLAETLCALNRERQQLEGEMFDDALRMLAADPPGNAPIVLACDTWHQGVAGIVASRLAERFSLPAIMICLRDGVGRGSCRSCGTFNIFDALADSGDLLLGFGGHEMAAGFTVREENMPAFRRRIREYYTAKNGAGYEKVLHVDAEVVKPGLITTENVDALSTLEPYGNGNPTPVLCMRDVQIQTVMPISGGKHTKFWISKGRETFECIFFSKTIEELGAEAGSTMDLVFEPRINEFRERRSVQLFLIDVLMHSEN